MLDTTEFFVGDEDPMYVQRWRRSDARREDEQHPIVLVPGGAHTGACWTSCPDGRRGWAQLLAEQGWTVFVVDWPGVGRSNRGTTSVSAGPGPVVDAVAGLLGEVGPAVVVAHSIGAALSLKVADTVPELVSALVAISPAPPGNVPTTLGGLVPADELLYFAPDQVLHLLANATRFPHDFLSNYTRSLCGYSPTIMNALADRDGSGDLVIGGLDRMAARPSLVLVGEEDNLTPVALTEEIAHFMGADHIALGADWGLDGFGHMIPIEVGSDTVLERVLDWMPAGLKP